MNNILGLKQQTISMIYDCNNFVSYIINLIKQFKNLSSIVKYKTRSLPIEGHWILSPNRPPLPPSKCNYDDNDTLLAYVQYEKK